MVNFPIHKTIDINGKSIDIHFYSYGVKVLWSNGDKLIDSDNLPQPQTIGDRFSVNQILGFLDNSIEKEFTDSDYQHVDFEQLKKVLTASDITGHRYVPQSHDCDDFARRAFNHVLNWFGLCAFGKVVGKPTWVDGKHQWNFFIDNEWKLHWYEPQSDTWTTPKKKDRVEWVYF